MKLLEILEEISIGSNQQDKNSRILSEYVSEVKAVLEKPDAVFENRAIVFNFSDDVSERITTQSQIFYQGSYAIHTAIKHRDHDVDVDIAFYIDDIADTNLRNRIYTQLQTHLGSKYTVEIKKPCITISFDDDYKVDVAVYSQSTTEGTMMFHNSIKGIEEKVTSVPKLIVKSFSDYLKDDNLKRPTVRLVKYFAKNAGHDLGISDDNKIPSISFMLLATKYLSPTNLILSEENLLNELTTFTAECIDFFEKYTVLDAPQLMIGNTLYKIKDMQQVIMTLKTVNSQLKVKNYGQLTSTKTFESIQKRSRDISTPSLIGTMG
ncbi:nucleotidyltransferase [Listeria innocua]|uniref:nucleotidyltransferase domain-containing protein n=1 Tax=Listeria innocua TaxID=1642 RepID=UPI0005EF0341|nr:nucleotidyltransferase [Listeria innocua]EAE6208695.1 nucleotidyltransferase [Listeria innocua]EDO1165325.1 nucleotidyltransferase [Listeria innocua]EDO1170691.1 nucleotidyltransferase [Listeria innocua]EEP3926948.1 nucleotidyltransferase [Listeria innocua]EHF3610831.1 nucleotidyltransferase [Listeria innocua]